MTFSKPVLRTETLGRACSDQSFYVLHVIVNSEISGQGLRKIPSKRCGVHELVRREFRG
ncbi:hypothetical protein D3C84_425610 [compost metagenome]